MDLKIFIPLALVMAVTTYLVRALPFTLFRKKITNARVKAFFDLIPYTVLSAMTFPAIFYATGDVVSSAVGTVIALVMAYFNLPLIAVALASSVGAFITSLIIGSI